MSRLVSRERELEADLESCGTTSEEDKTGDDISTDGQTASTQPLGFHGFRNSSNFSKVAVENMEFLIDNSMGEESQQHIAFVGNKDVEEKHKKNTRKPPKPPRPPNGTPLDAADQKLMQEITELAMRKRARNERIKALKKMRAAKASSWNGSLSALVVTIVFCIIIIYQGISSRNNESLSLKGSPDPAIISIQFYKNNAAFESDESGSGSPHLAGRQVSGSGLQKKRSC